MILALHRLNVTKGNPPDHVNVHCSASGAISGYIIATQTPAHAGRGRPGPDRDRLLGRMCKRKRDSTGICIFIVTVIAGCLAASNIPVFRNFFGIATSV